jgi:hypothetical protein
VLPRLCQGLAPPDDAGALVGFASFELPGRQLQKMDADILSGLHFMVALEVEAVFAQIADDSLKKSIAAAGKALQLHDHTDLRAFPLSALFRQWHHLSPCMVKS